MIGDNFLLEKRIQFAPIHFCPFNLWSTLEINKGKVVFFSSIRNDSTILGSEFDSANNMVLSEVITSLLKQSQNRLCSDISQKTIQHFPPTTGRIPSISFIFRTDIPVCSIDVFKPGIKCLIINFILNTNLQYSNS